MPTQTNPADDAPLAAPAQPTAQPSAATAAQVAEPENPSAGGHYLRDPVTGALTRNPAFTDPQE